MTSFMLRNDQYKSIKKYHRKQFMEWFSTPQNFIANFHPNLNYRPSTKPLQPTITHEFGYIRRRAVSARTRHWCIEGRADSWVGTVSQTVHQHAAPISIRDQVGCVSQFASFCEQYAAEGSKQKERNGVEEEALKAVNRWKRKGETLVGMLNWLSFRSFWEYIGNRTCQPWRRIEFKTCVQTNSNIASSWQISTSESYYIRIRDFSALVFGAWRSAPETFRIGDLFGIACNAKHRCVWLIVIAT